MRFLVVAVGLLPAAVLSAQPDAKTEPAAEAKPADAADDKGLPWLSGLEEGHRHALADGKPVLVRVGAAWCPVCRTLAAEIEKPAVQEELGRWTLVYVDAAKDAEDARKLNVLAVPALRLRTPAGRAVASRDGAMSAPDLVRWLKRNYEAALAAPDDVLMASTKPDAVAVLKLVEQFEDRSPAVRETAVRRLLGCSELASTEVVKAFREGRLAVRLTALELLLEWRAPVQELDPWRPETMTSERLAALEKWAGQAAKTPAPPAKPSADELAAADAQIDRMLKATDEEADAIRQRLARLGAALLPGVYTRLQQAVTDQHRERLLALRYRLVADDSLALRWPGGLIRLAATDSRQRQRAAEELAKRAAVQDQRLLLELFSDPDPLVREICLRGLQHIGGKAASGALVDLLADPEPNVRAAVLKQLEENPQQSMVPKVVEYLKNEKDPDLIVHAIRFLRAAGGAKAVAGLMGLLKHESWQVRAEAAAGINSERGFRGARNSVALDEADDATKLQADACVALIELLDDPDAFVVSRAVESLSGADMVVAVEPLVKAADKHPDLAASIVEMLARGEKMRPKALPHLREFCKHPDAAIRAAAVDGMVKAGPNGVEEQISAALQDAESSVRVAAATSLFHLLNNQREATMRSLREKSMSGTSPNVYHSRTFVEVDVPAEGLLSKAVRALAGTLRAGEPEKPAAKEQTPTKDDEEPAERMDSTEEKEPPEGEEKPEDDESPWDRRLKEFHAGKQRPKWLDSLAAPLEKMLSAKAAEERVAAAAVLVPMGKAEAALPVLLDAARSSPDVYDRAVKVLPWLVWEERLKLFGQLRALAKRDHDLSALVYAMTEVPDFRAAAPLWELMADKGLTAEVASALDRGLKTAYFGERYYSPSEASPSRRAELARAAKPRATSGGDLQRLAALTLLIDAAADDAVEIAGKLADDSSLSKDLRRDAFQIMLAVQTDEKKRSRAAIEALAGDDPDRKKLALTVLVDGPESLSSLRGSFQINVHSSSESRRSGEPIVPKAPAGVELEQVRPLLDDPDPRIAAYAGYLMALLEDRGGMDALVRYWRAKNQDDDNSYRLVYRAVAAIDDAKYLPALKDIYSKLDEQRLSDFYWTIRIMSGPEIVKFRKEIRDQHGMSRLR